jgi:energy-coupling factor transporter ATP-binding protein EcfA2
VWLQGLQDCADTLVGSAMFGIKGISGGEMKRTMVATELVTSPKCLFLDEPTSGLDSEIALALVRALRDVATSGRTVALTIHQPNSDISELFDDFMLLAKGRVMYAGVLAHSLRGCACSPIGPFFDRLDVLLHNVTSHICTILTRIDVCLGIHALVY